MAGNLHEIFTRFPKNFPLPMVLDGSTGTSLIREGMPSGYCTEKWVLEHPDILQKIQRSYIENGSDALCTPTFGANRPTLERNGFTDIEKTNSELAAITIGRGCLAGGDMSPTGLFIEPFGETPFDDAVAIYREQAAILDRAGVDYFAVETCISLQEARAAVIGIREVSEKPVFVTMTVDDNGRTLSGDNLACCLLTLSELGIAAFGTNCSQGPDSMLELLRGLVPYSLSLGIPLIAKPNAGLPHEDETGCSRFDLDAETFASYIPGFLSAGIPVLGGCCGTDAAFIRRIRECTDAVSSSLDYSMISRRDLTGIVCTNREIVNVAVSPSDVPITADEDFYDNAVDSENSFLFVSLPDETAADIFIENAPMITLPCAVCGSDSALLKAKRYYNGVLLLLPK